MTQNVPPQDEAEEQERRRRPWFLLPWMLLIFLILFCCGQLALLTGLQGAGADTRSQMRADYSPWAFMPMAPLDPGFLYQVAEDLGWPGVPPIATAIACLLPGQNCNGTPTPTGTLATPTTDPGATATPATGTPTATRTPDLPTHTPTNAPPTSTPTQTPTPTPLVYPVKQASPSRISPGAATVDFTIRVINYGSPAPAILTRLTDTMPPQMTYRAGSCVPGCTTGSGQTVEWLGTWSIPQGSFITFRFTADVSGTTGGEELVNWIVAEGTNFQIAQNNRRVTVLTPTPTATPTTFPVAGNDVYGGTEDTVLNVAAPGLLANDTDANGDPLSVQPTPSPSPAHGVVTLNADGSFSYTPTANYYGADTFGYTVCDPILCDTATVTITLAGVEDFPVAVDDSYSPSEDTVSVYGPAAGVRANDYDPDDLIPPPNDTLTISLLTPPSNGGLLPSVGCPTGLCADGSFTYTPAGNWYGTDSFTYQACDPTARCDNATATLNVLAVNDAPVAVGDPGLGGPLVTLEDTPIDIEVVANDTDIDNANSDLCVATGSVSVLSGGTADILLGAPCGPSSGRFVRFTPALNANDSNAPQGFRFTYRVTDGTAISASAATVTINVTPVNDAPVAVADTWQLNLGFITGQGVDMVVPPSGVLLNDTDVDLDPLTTDLVSNPSNGTLDCPANPPYALCPNGGFTYTPDAGYHGVDIFTYRAYDSALYSGTVEAILLVDDPPVSRIDLFTTVEDTPLSVGVPGVLGDNGFGADTDLNGDALSVQLVAAPLQASAFTLSADGSFSYSPVANFFGWDSFQYRAFDGWLYGNTTTAFVQITPQNDAPVAAPDSARTPVNTPITIDVLATDTDVEGGPLRVAAIVSPPTQGGVVNNAVNVTYTPGPGYVGNDFFEYQVCDPGFDLIPGNGDDLCDTAWVSVLVNGPPNGVDDSYSLGEDTTYSELAPGVQGNDTDPNGDPLTVWLLGAPSNGVLLGSPGCPTGLCADGSFSYRPTLDYAGPDSFTYTVCDPDICDPTPPATVNLTILSDQDPPDAVDDDAGSILEDTPVDVFVLLNDSDPDGDMLRIVSVANPPHGTAVIRDNGTPGNTGDDFIRYTPDWDYFGTDAFVYTIGDGNGGFDTATITVTISPVNDPPHANDDWYRTDVDTPVVRSAPGLLGNDPEPEGQPKTAALVSGPMPGASALVNANGAFTYTPAPGYHGDDSFDYQACDDTLPVPLCETATVHISMNRAPVTNPDSYSLVEDGILVVPPIGVLINDSDPEGDIPLTASLVVTSPPSPPSGPFHGAITFNPDGSFSYTPDAGYAGADDFDYRACDTLGACTTETVSIAVMPVNDAPVAEDDPEAPTVYRANVGGTAPLVVPAGSGVLANDTDTDNLPSELRAGLLVGPTNGLVSPLATDGSFTYTPNPSFAGTDTFSYTVCDPGQDTIPTTPDDLCDVGNVTILVNGVPMAVDDAYGTNEDVLLSVVAPGVLGNDTDPEGQPLTAALVSGPAGLTFNADGSFTYAPPLNFHSPPDVTFVYEACDPWGTCDTATATVAVNAVNDPPTAFNDSVWTNFDQPVDIYVLANDTDVDIEPVLLDSPLTAVTAGGSAVWTVDHYVFTPNPGYYTGASPDQFAYTIRDAAFATSSAIVSITVNGPPTAGPAESYSTNEDIPLVVSAPGLLANDSDPNGDALEAYLVTGPSQALSFSLNLDGSFSYTPMGNYFGPDSFSYEVCDVLPGGLCTPAITVDLTIMPVNDPPIARDDGPYNTDEDTQLIVDAWPFGLLGNDDDPIEFDPVIAVAASGTSAQGGSYSVLADGSFSYTPAANFHGTDTFNYRAFDGTDPSAPATVTIVVAPVNDPPLAVSDLAPTDQLLPVWIDAVGNDTDVDGLLEIVPASAAVVSGPTSGSVVNNGNGTFTYTPAAGQYWSDSFTYTVEDVWGATSNVATVTINIRPAVLQVLKEAIPDTAMLGDTVDFYIYLWNNGPGTAYAVNLSDALGTCFAYVGPPPDGPLGDIAEGGAVVRVVLARVVGDSACSNTNTAQVSAANAATVSDSVSVTLLPMGGGGAPLMMSLLGPDDAPIPELEPSLEPTPDPTVDATPEPTMVEPAEEPLPATAIPPEPEETSVPEPTPLVVSQGSLMADAGNPLGWVALILSGIWFGRYLVFKVHIPAHRAGRGIRYHEPATRPRRG